jgi:protocatechuate 3,4-dioxygenase beta subunit
MLAPFTWRMTVPLFTGISLTRRAALAAVASSPALAVATRVRAEETATQSTLLTPSCILTPQADAGPYYFDAKMRREDITEGHPGAPLQLRFVVLQAGSCKPLAGARVDVWHARADGFYSGYRGQGDDHTTDTSGGTFMRGTQFAGPRGEVSFRTVYPGWYEGRTAHIHFKVFTDEKSVLTGQMYFPDALSQYLYTNVSAYKRKAARSTFNYNDGLALMDLAHGGFCDIKEEADHYLATLILGIDQTGATARNQNREPPDFGGGSARRGPASLVPGLAASKPKNG